MLSEQYNENPIRVLIVDDHTVLRKGLISLLSTPRFNIEVVGEAADGSEAIQQTTLLQPDVILLDLVMPGMGGLEAIPKLKAGHPNVHILVLTSFNQDENIVAAVRAGAEGYLKKDCSPDELIHAIKGVYMGQFSLPADMARKVMDLDSKDKGEVPEPRLTPRELDVLRLIAQGFSNQEIAGRLSVSTYTVRSHVRSILRKLDVNNRTQAALYAIEKGMVDPPQ